MKRGQAPTIIILLILIGLLSALAGVLFGLVKLPDLITSQPVVALLAVGAALGGLGYWLYRAQSQSPPETASPAGYPRWMLSRVRTIFDNQHDDFLQGMKLFELGLHEQADAVISERVSSRRRPNQPTQNGSSPTRIVQEYENAQEQLLILGKPGAGKSTLLRILARDLLQGIEEDERKRDDPLPLIFNLASWAVKQQPLDVWMAEEIARNYKYQHGQSWIEAGAILPLLDGLDEVAEEQRSACVEAINAYRETHGLPPTVVCSRKTDYLDQPARLRLQGAVVVEPLSQQQIDERLSSEGEPLSGLRQALATDKSLQSLSPIPLWLNLMVLAYQGLPAQQIIKSASPSARQQQVLDDYVRRMLSRRLAALRYTQEQTRRWLGRLARHMRGRGQPTFYLDQLQADWLSRRQRLLYRVCDAAIVMLLVGLGFGLCAGPDTQSNALGLGQITSFEVINSSDFGLGSFLGFGISSGVSFGFMLGLLAGGAYLLYYLYLLVEQSPKIQPKIQPKEAFSWSWKNVRARWRFWLLCGLIGGVGGGWLVSYYGSTGWPIVFWLGGLLAIVAGVLVTGITAKQLPEPPNRSPNESIRRSARNGLIFGLVGGIGFALLIGLVIGLAQGPLSGSFNDLINTSYLTPAQALNDTFVYVLGDTLGFVLSFWVLAGILIGLHYGGTAVLRYRLLLFFLYRAKVIPRRPVPFLEDASERLLLRKVGGGYSFIHRLLLDYFVALEIAAEAPTISAAQGSSAATRIQNRQQMLAFQRTYLITQRADALRGETPLTLKPVELPDAVTPISVSLAQPPDQPMQPLSSKTPIARAYEEARGQLLILGEPDAGKTMLLQELALALLDQAEQDEDAPMPVIFNLASWAVKRQPLDVWMVKELAADPLQVDHQLGRFWLKADAILPLLDGLDEVDTDHLSTCVEAINTYRQTHVLLPTVVCSRTSAYNFTSLYLQLENAVMVEPLSQQQIDERLSRPGQPLEGLRQALTADDSMRELAHTPIMLNLLIRCYQGLTVEEIMHPTSFSTNQKQALAEYVQVRLQRHGADTRYRKKQSLTEYVRGRIQRLGTGTGYTQKQTERWLGWLARQMVWHDQAEFHSDQLQPDWLSGYRRAFFRPGARLIVGLSYVLAAGLAVGLGIGSVVGVLYGLAVGQHMSDPASQVGALFGGMISWLVGGPVIGLYFALPIGLFVGMGYALLGWLIDRRFSERAMRLQPSTVLIWSGRKALSNLGRQIVGGLIAGLLCGLFGWLAVDVRYGLLIGLAAGLIVWLLSGLVGGISGEQGTEQAKRSLSKGAKRSTIGRNNYVLSFGLGFAMLGEMASLLPNKLTVGVAVGLAAGLLVGLLGWLHYGGTAVIRYKVLRFFLWNARVMPKNYTRFLDDASKRMLLRKEEGRYSFARPLLWSYFALLGGVQAVPAPTAQSSSAAAPERLCPNCGEFLPVSARFCGRCGQALTVPVTDGAKGAPGT